MELLHLQHAQTEHELQNNSGVVLAGTLSGCCTAPSWLVSAIIVFFQHYWHLVYPLPLKSVAE